MIECAVGRKCGGWVHFSCAGVSLNEAKKEKKEEKKEKAKPRAKKERE